MGYMTPILGYMWSSRHRPYALRTLRVSGCCLLFLHFSLEAVQGFEGFTKEGSHCGRSLCQKRVDVVLSMGLGS